MPPQGRPCMWVGESEGVGAWEPHLCHLLQIPPHVPELCGGGHPCWSDAPSRCPSGRSSCACLLEAWSVACLGEGATTIWWWSCGVDGATSRKLGEETAWSCGGKEAQGGYENMIPVPGLPDAYNFFPFINPWVYFSQTLTLIEFLHVGLAGSGYPLLPWLIAPGKGHHKRCTPRDQLGRHIIYTSSTYYWIHRNMLHTFDK